MSAEAIGALECAVRHDMEGTLRAREEKANIMAMISGIHCKLYRKVGQDDLKSAPHVLSDVLNAAVLHFWR